MTKGKTMMLLAIGAALAVSPLAVAQTAKSNQDKNKPRVVLGTTQMAGDNGKVDVAYTIGKTDPVNITLHSAVFTVTRWNVGHQSIAPNKDEKLLLLTYTVHNPNKEATSYNGSTLKFTVVDQEDVNHVFVNQVTRKDGDEPLSIELKPAQKIQCQTVIVVPAKGTVPKLIVEHRNGGPVLRYDLRPIIKGLGEPFAGDTPNDAKTEIEGVKEQYYPMMNFDLRYMDHSFQERKLGVHTIGEDKIFFMAKIQFKKQTRTGHILRFGGEVQTEDGDRYPLSSILKASVEESAGSVADYGQEVMTRMYWVVPKGTKISKIRVWEAQGKESRIYIFPINVQAPGGKTESPTQPTTTSQEPAVTGPQADEYTTLLKKADGTTALEVGHTAITKGNVRSTLITYGAKRAILNQELQSGQVTLFLPDTGEVLRAPKGQGKDPVTSLDYFYMAYANAAAPKPKKKNLLGNIAGAVLGGAVNDLGGQLISGAVLAGFGEASAPALMSAAVQNVRGYAVQQFAWKLGRATMEEMRPTDGSGPSSVDSQVTVDKKIYVQSTFKGRKAVNEADYSVDTAKAKDVDAKEMYKRFSEFFAEGLGTAK